MNKGNGSTLMEDKSDDYRSGSKRKMADNDGYHNAEDLPPFKRCRQGEGPRAELRILLKSNSSGAIIGKSGTNIKRLRETYKANVTIPDCNGPERIFSISSDLGTALEILRDSLPRTVEIPEQQRTGPTDVEVRLLIHQSQAGGVIGKAGKRIQEIRDTTKANIKVFAQCCPMSTDRVVQITGKVDQVVDTVQQVWEIANEAGVKGSSQPYDPFNFDDFNSSEYGGFGGGGNYGPRGGMGDGGMNMSWGMSGSGGGGGGMRGGMRGGRTGGGMLPNRGMPPARGGNMSGRGGYENSRYRNSTGGQGLTDPTFAGQPNTANSQGEQTTQQVSIPKDLAGSIIGPQGTRIRAIRAQSGAQIIIGKAEPATDDRVITINGTEEQIQNAQYLMQMAVRQHSGKF